MEIESKLNKHQYEAASSESQYLRIIAGAGTGKTRTLTYRIAYLITKGILPNRMVAITFTNKAAKEMQTRVDQLLSENDFFVTSKPLMVTFHGFCYRFLKKEIGKLQGYTTNFNIADDADQNQIYKDIFSSMNKGSSKDFTKAVISKISDLKTRGKFFYNVTQDDVPLGSIYDFRDLIGVYQKYQEYLNQQNLLDFDDLLMLTLKILKENDDVRKHWQSKYDIFLVDEFQDTNNVQYQLVKLLLSPTCKLTVVGDPDQTIYTWRGAKNDIIKDRLSNDFPTLQTVVLDENYRSTQSILNAANELIKHNHDRMDKNLIAASHVEGDRVYYTNYGSTEEEARSIVSTIANLVAKEGAKYDDIAIIYRANYLSGPIEHVLANRGIPYEVYGGMKFYERAEVKDALSYLRLIVNPDDLSFRRTLKAPSKSIGEVALANALKFKENLIDEDNSLFSVFKYHSTELHLMKKSVIALDRFYNAYENVVKVYQYHENNSELITAINNYFRDSGFMEYVASEDKKNEEKLSYTAASSMSKMDNVSELIRSLSSYLDTEQLDDDGKFVVPTLEDFLIDVALQSDQDTMKDTPKVALMTGHVSKGLEFPYVFVSGLNQSIFPTNHALMEMKKSAIEEERRLLYVCVTRAQKKLYLSSFGGYNVRNSIPYSPSMFLKELGLNSISKPKETNEQRFSSFMGNSRPSTASKKAGISAAVGISKPIASTTDTYNVGDYIVHTSYGKGKVIEVFPGGKINVQFKDEVGVKKLIVGFKAFRKMTKEEIENGNNR